MKYTVITGASSGIGYQTALEFAKKGKNLIIIARRVDRLEQLKEEVLKLNSKLDVVLKVADLSKREQNYELYRSLKEYHIETWINNAGLGGTSSVVDESLERIENLIDVNVTALSLLSTLYAQDYENIEGAQLINVSSALGYVIAPGNVVYSATKFFVSAYTEGLARELISKGSKLRAKVLAPAMTETEFIKAATNVENFDYSTRFQKFHKANEMASFMIQLYESDHIVGIVNNDYEFELRDVIFPTLERL